ncbi:sulfotransferase [Pseudooceanicola sp. HF7]|uniref:sulfotransferase family protein n=1 Tax=Pseudooceanicola sp. HF7 TaxID=2721560 RepID=UPI00143127EE|nr:sulfotransferase [Pseudooceanicola sp. HF7]NIZ07941.1 sulfotransferase [Pseudooceanicola sp. HF7]
MPIDEPISPVLVLSTGRCGSTLVSQMLNKHPEVLSLSEFFATLGPEIFAHRRLTGAQLWRIFSCQSAGLRAMFRNGEMVDEGLYPVDDPKARFSLADVPPIMTVALPHLTPDYESLYDELGDVVRPLPAAPLADQLQVVFAFLQKRLSRRVWVERSGSSLMLARRMLRLFPEARVIHVHRDGRDVALSMAKHHNFRVLVGGLKRCRALGLDPARAFRSDRGSMADVWFQALFFRLTDPGKLADGVTDPDLAAYWSDLIETGLDAFADLPPERLFTLAFADLADDPRSRMEALIRFIDPSLVDEAWLDEVATMIRPTRSRAASLPPAQRDALTQAARPGLSRLGYLP